jgi:hypothetical protein
MIVLRLFLLTVFCCLAMQTSYATLGYRAGQSLNKAITPVTKRFFGATKGPWGGQYTQQYNVESRVEQLGQERLKSGQPIKQLGESVPQAPARDIRGTYARSKALMAEKPTTIKPAAKWSSGNVAHTWSAQNQGALATAAAVGAGALGYVGAQSGVKSRGEKFQTQKLWESLGLPENMPTWFNKQEFEKAKNMLPAGSSNSAIFDYMRNREFLRQNIQVTRKISALPAAEQVIWKARFAVAKKTYSKKMMPLEIWQMVQEQQEESPAVRSAVAESNKPGKLKQMYENLRK